MKVKIFLLACVVMSSAAVSANSDNKKDLLTSSSAPSIAGAPGSGTILRCDHKVEATSCPDGYYAAGYVFNMVGRVPAVAKMICCSE